MVTYQLERWISLRKERLKGGKMIINNYKYGISLLPDNCIAYKDGYRYGAYKQNLSDINDMHIVEWFKTKEEIQAFVNKNTKYGKEN